MNKLDEVFLNGCLFMMLAISFVEYSMSFEDYIDYKINYHWDNFETTALVVSILGMAYLGFEHYIGRNKNASKIKLNN